MAMYNGMEASPSRFGSFVGHSTSPRSPWSVRVGLHKTQRTRGRLSRKCRKSVSSFHRVFCGDWIVLLPRLCQRWGGVHSAVGRPSLFGGWISYGKAPGTWPLRHFYQIMHTVQMMTANAPSQRNTRNIDRVKWHKVNEPNDR